MSDIATATANIKKALETRAFITTDRERIVSQSGVPKSGGWLFDVRRILLDASILDDIGSVFWDKFGSSFSFQIAGVETAAIPLVTGLVAHGYASGHRDSSGFFLRKSRKKSGLTRMIEGDALKDKPVILVDDLMNSGKSLIRQVEIMEELGIKVAAIWVIIRFRDLSYYDAFFAARGIRVHALFELDDFNATLGTKNLELKSNPIAHDQFRKMWRFQSPDPSYQHVVPKSEPAIDAERLYVGSDSGVFWALSQKTGDVVWSLKTGHHPKGKGIFSSPALFNDLVFFGAYDGNFYAVEAATGKKRWIYFDADWIGSSPAVADDLGIVYVGLEFGLWRKRGGITAIDAKSGKEIWKCMEMPCYTHGSPLYIQKHREVVIGSNDGCVYAFDAARGDLKWKYQGEVLPTDALDSGFSPFDIKGRPAYDEKNDRIIVCNLRGDIVAINRADGSETGRYTAEFGFYSSPVVTECGILAASLDKRLYCLDTVTLSPKWRWEAGARIFATPSVIENKIYLGANTGRLTIIDPKTGADEAFVQFTERITNRVVHNPLTKRLFVTTFANEVYCLEKKLGT